MSGAHPRWLSPLTAFARDGAVLDRHVKAGRFQRSLSAIAGVSGLLSGLEVALQHYRASYNQRVMYSPVALGALLFAAGVGGAISPRVARNVLPFASAAMLADGALGFGFHVRGIARRPGGWRIPVFNVVMGPPIFAPLLLGIGGVLGLAASMLRPEGSAWRSFLRRPLRARDSRLARRVREGRFQRTLAAATAASAVLNGVEALYSHYKTDFRYRAQWIPVVVALPLAGASAAAIFSGRAARQALPPFAALALLAGGVGVFYHARGVVRRPGGMTQPLHNLTYGPPIFAPLLFAASGFLGLLTSRLRRER